MKYRKYIIALLIAIFVVNILITVFIHTFANAISNTVEDYTEWEFVVYDNVQTMYFSYKDVPYVRDVINP